MGTGKGPMQFAVAELLNAYPVAIATPAHMVKFAREAHDTSPGAKPVIINTVADLMALRKRYKPGDKLDAVHLLLRIVEGRPGQARAGHPRHQADRAQGLNHQQVVKTEAKRIYRCPKCGGEAPANIFGKRAKSRKCDRQLEIREPNGKIVLRTCGEKLLAVWAAQEMAARPFRPRAHPRLLQARHLRRGA